MDRQTVKFKVLRFSTMPDLEMMGVQTQQLQNAASAGHSTMIVNFGSPCCLRLGYDEWLQTASCVITSKCFLTRLRLADL
ncbi:hypothetical protein TNCV_1556791 [Trichonephila clavipes]|nr:hypothetical protein TNCV_1556791 [Trichonephila clavipes]